MTLEVSRTLTTRSSLGAKIDAAAKRKVRAKLDAIADDAAVRSSRLFRAEYEQQSGVGANSFRGRVEGRSLPARVIVETTEPHVSILNRGAPPHEITASRAPLLVFEVKAPTFTKAPRKNLSAARHGGGKRFVRSDAAGTGQIIRTPSVKHPGVKPGRFMERAVRQAFRAAGLPPPPG